MKMFQINAITKIRINCSTFSLLDSKLDMKFITLPCILSGNNKPSDRTYLKISQESMMISLPIIIIMWLMAAVGIICSLGFLHFNISNGKNR